MAELFSTHVIKSASKGPNGLIIAGVHGDEYQPVLAGMKLIDQVQLPLFPLPIEMLIFQVHV